MGTAPASAVAVVSRAEEIARYTSGVLLAREAYHHPLYCHGSMWRRFTGSLETCDKCRAKRAAA